PAFIANRICGYIPSLAKIPEPEKASLTSFVNYRTEFFDRIMEKNIDSMNQVVFMGAGFDTRAFKYCKEKDIKVFELDKENIQNCKIEALKKSAKNELFLVIPASRCWIFDIRFSMLVAGFWMLDS
ncbi:unnamed protein product, partial [marine sediment metagenome]